MNLCTQQYTTLYTHILKYAARTHSIRSHYIPLTCYFPLFYPSDFLLRVLWDLSYISIVCSFYAAIRLEMCLAPSRLFLSVCDSKGTNTGAGIEA